MSKFALHLACWAIEPTLRARITSQQTSPANCGHNIRCKDPRAIGSSATRAQGAAIGQPTKRVILVIEVAVAAKLVAPHIYPTTGSVAGTPDVVRRERESGLSERGKPREEHIAGCWNRLVLISGSGAGATPMSSARGHRCGGLRVGSIRVGPCKLANIDSHHTLAGLGPPPRPL